MSPAGNIMIRFTRNPADDAAVKEILSRGNFPLLVGDTILAEIANTELTDGLEATATLSVLELSRLSADLADNIHQALSSDCAGYDIAELAADAAALFVVCLRWQQVSQGANHQAMCDRDRLVEVTVAIAGRVHEHVLGVPVSCAQTRGGAQAPGGVCHEPAGVSVQALDRHVVTQARADRAAAGHQVDELVVAQCEQVGLDHRYAIVRLQVLRKPIRRSDHGSDGLVAYEQLIEQKPASGSRCTHDKRCHRFPPSVFRGA
jgi:hypothetical protein